MSMDLIDVDYRLDTIRVAAERWAMRRTVEVWDDYFRELESADELPREKLEELKAWNLRKFFEARNVLTAPEGSRPADEIAWARQMMPKAESLDIRLDELLATN